MSQQKSGSLELFADDFAFSPPPPPPRDPPARLDCGCRPPRAAWERDGLTGGRHLRGVHVCENGVAWGDCEGACAGGRWDEPAEFMWEAPRGTI